MRLLIIGLLGGEVGTASKIARDRGAQVACADDIATGLAHVRAGKGTDVILADVALDIAALITGLRSERISVPVVACGIGNDARKAVAAIKAGAKDYIPLPPHAELIGAVLTAVAHDERALLYADPRMAEVLALADRVAASDASVLILGASGTGKEVMARYLHGRSKRAAEPFVAINCAAIPDALLESELFGHEKGAFTGAVARRTGRFEEAHGGTLLLDEVSEMDPRLQAKLLRAVQEREITRVGGSQTIRINVRLLATSNRNLEACVRDGTFREDLYFRLNVVSLRLPPLAERRGDIPLLASHFIAKYAELNGAEARRLSPQAERLLVDYTWPGNVRELENAIHRAVLLANGEAIGPEAIILGPPESGLGRATGSRAEGTASAEPVAVGTTLADMERSLIIDTLQHCLGNRTHAATVLGISIRTLRNKLRQYASEGIPVPPAGQLVGLQE
ncbi:MAG: sigma-54-dependent Fis family transcriptional regulator [Rhodospirillales bacterium]|nr:sigma-54-dependent Fis family transcriptional regulator [Rhodospirillales bacterium]